MLRSTILAALGLALTLSACGQGASRGGADNAAPGATCALLTNASQLFGEGFQAVEYRGTDGMAGTCEFQSADGVRGGDLLTYTQASLGSVTLDAQLAETTQRWDAQTETALGTINGLGDQSSIATDLPGYQTHIAFRRGDTLVLIAARSGDAHMDGEALARAMAQSVAAALPAQ